MWMVLNTIVRAAAGTNWNKVLCDAPSAAAVYAVLQSSTYRQMTRWKEVLWLPTSMYCKLTMAGKRFRGWTEP